MSGSKSWSVFGPTQSHAGSAMTNVIAKTVNPPAIDSKTLPSAKRESPKVRRRRRAGRRFI